MKTVKTKLLCIVCLIIGIVSCDEDDSVNVDSTPEFVSFVNEISSLPGETIVFQGVISDPAGVEKVNIKYEPWFLDKTIIKDSLPDIYELAYSFKIPDGEAKNSVHTIPVTVSNVGGVEVTSDVVITLDLDIANPTIQIASPAEGSTIIAADGNEIDLNITVADEALAEFKIESSILNETIAISGDTFNYSESLDLEVGRYEFIITATDESGNTSNASVNVNVINDLQFDVMYITDVTSDSDLNNDLFGIPYNTEASEVSTDDGFVFTGRFYSAAANTEVRFLPQIDSFEPFSFGADADGNLAFGSDASVSPIILPGIGYYMITMDLRDQSLSITPFTPTDDVFGQVYVIGRGIFVDDTSTCVVNADGSLRCFHWSSGKPFNKDASNDYLWTLDVTIKDEPSDAARNGFILNANPENWAPFWRTNPEDRSIAVPGGGTNYFFDESDLDKDYKFVFDTHLNRLALINR